MQPIKEIKEHVKPIITLILIESGAISQQLTNGL